MRSVNPAQEMAGTDANRAVNLSLDDDVVKRARAEGLNLSAVAAALARIAKARFEAEIAQGCQVHEEYLVEYGSLGDTVRAMTRGEKHRETAA